MSIKAFSRIKKEAAEMEAEGIRHVAMYATTAHVMHISESCIDSLDRLDEKFSFTYRRRNSQVITASVKAHNRVTADDFFASEFGLRSEDYIVDVEEFN